MTTPTSLNALLGNSGADDATTAAMQLTADNLGPAIMAGLGTVSLDDITTAEVVLVTLLLDDSGSIRFAGNAQSVRDGHNAVLDSLRASKQSASVLISCRYLNDGPGTTQGVLYPYVTLDGAQRLDSSNYDPMGGTPLYDQTAVTLTAVAAKLAEFEQGGVAARAVTVIVTDGADYHSQHETERSVNKIVCGLLATEQHIVAGMGIEDPGGPVDFRKVFQDMGIQDEWILTPGSSQSEIRRAFQTVSQSAVRASQTATGFSQVAMGGFGG